MKHILLFGAGKSATFLINYLNELAEANKYLVTVADQSLENVQSKVKNCAFIKAASVNVENESERSSLIKPADIVISLLPPALHYLVATGCIKYRKHLLTASYVDEKIRSLQPQIESEKILFLCEMGLDPGIDHMSAMQLIDKIKAAGGKITSFKSHCGGLVAPESDDNPWHYKISWNPANIIAAGKSGAAFKENGEIKHLEYENLFNDKMRVSVNENMLLSGYPNRDSLSYIPIYNLENTDTFIRTTLRHPDFCTGWKTIVDLKLTDETIEYDTNNMTTTAFFSAHFHQFKLNDKMNEILQQTKVTVAGEKTNEAEVILEQLYFLGLKSDELLNQGKCTAAKVMQYILEKKLTLQNGDKDMVVMLHEIEYETSGTHKKITSSLIVKGEDHIHTAMAKTVGLPLGIAVKLILDGSLTITGLHIPTIPAVYKPVLKGLEKHEIIFTEEFE